MIREFENGLRLVYEERQGVSSYCCVLVGVGSRHENKNQWGMAHLLEHMVFKGTKNRNSFQIVDEVESVGGDFNAYTTKEDTCYHISIANNYFENAVSVLSDMLFNSIFEEKDLKKEIGVVLDEIDSYEDSPSELIADEFESLVFQGSSLEHKILGEKRTLKRYSSDDLRSFYNDCYVPNNMVFSYVGGIEFEKVVQLVQKYFVAKKKEITYIGNDGIFKVAQSENHRDTNQVHCMIGSKSYGLYDSLRTEMIFINNYIGGPSFNSLLNFKLREDKGITYNIESNCSVFSDIGVFSVYFGTDERNYKECLDIIYNEFELLHKQGLSDALFLKWKEQLKGQVALSFDHFTNRMIYNARNVMLYGKKESVDEIMNKLDALELNNVNNAIHDVLDVNNFSKILYK